MKRTNRIFSIIIALFFCILLIYPIILGDIPSSNEDLSQTLSASGRSSARIAKPVGNGPYSTSFITTGIPRANNTNVTARIYFPVKSGGVDPAGAPYPAIVFAPGAGGYETSYQSTLSQIASWGYIVTIVGTGGPCNQEVVDIQSYVLDYYEAQNSDPKSIFNKNIDTNSYGASGHSNGGWAAIAGGVADPRFKAISPLCAAAGPTYGSGQANTRNLHVPLQLVAGADDVTFLPSSDAYYSLANPIKSYIKLTGSGHGGPFHLEYLVSFFKVWLNHDFEYSTFVYGDDVYSDLAKGDIQFESSVGLTANPSTSKQNVYEDEEVIFIGEGVITEPTGPNRNIFSFEWDLDFDGVYEWSSNSSGSTNYSYSQDGNYEAGFKVKDSWGMIATASTSVIVKNKKPVAMAGDNKMGAEDELISFDGSDSFDTISDISSLRYMWNFGDGNTTNWGAYPNTAHIFTQKGNYTLELMVMDDDGEIASDWKIVSIKNIPPDPVLKSDKTMVEIKEVIDFDASGSSDTPSDNGSLKYIWDFGDGTTFDGLSVTHSYDDEGTYLVSLKVMDDDNDWNIATTTIIVLNAEPTCETIENQIINEDEVVSFTGTGYDSKSDMNTLSYSWDIGIEGIPSTPWNSSADLEYRYTNKGVYTAVLTVKDDDGSTATKEVIITVLNTAPIARYKSSSKGILEDEVVMFDAGISIDSASDQDTLNYSWDFDDKSPKRYGKYQSYTFQSAGEYNVKLTVTDDNEATDSFTQKITVNNLAPKAIITTSTTKTKEGMEIIFSGHESIDSPSDKVKLAYNWDFDDKTYAKGKLVKHTYSEPGRYDVELTIVDDNGEYDTAVVEIRISELSEVSQPKTTESNDNNLFIFAGIVNVILILVLILILFLYLRKKPPEEPQDEQIGPIFDYTQQPSYQQLYQQNPETPMQPFPPFQPEQNIPNEPELEKE